MMGKKKTYLIHARHSRLPLPASEDKDLVDRVYFIANIAADGDFHRDDLAVEPRMHDFPELAERADFGGEFGEVDHLVLGRILGHVRVFAHFGGREGEGAGGVLEGCWDCGRFWEFVEEESGWKGASCREHWMEMMKMVQATYKIEASGAEGCFG